MAQTREEYNAYQRAWRAKNAEKSRAISRASYARYAEDRRAAKRVYDRAIKERGQTDTERLADRLKKSARAAMKRGAAATLTAAEWATICETYDQRCAYCGTNAFLEQEHVIPLTRGGTHTADNVVPACKPCNSAKGDKTAREWLLGAA